ncbi:MAG: hypothetical protein R3Y24_13080 [Eubacteriales bacterium]
MPEVEESNKDTTESSFIDIVYQQINSVIGGASPNQFLCLTLPGQVLTAEDYAYDYKNNLAKGASVEAKESKLANKLFDSCRMVGSDNGLTLPYQYRSALDVLTPKLNLKVAEAKNQLRQLLMTEYFYDFGDGVETKTTLQDVYFRLFDDWVNANEAWAETQNKKKEELRKKYNESDASDNAKYNNAYLEWYETVAESNLNIVNEKMSKLISVFTPNDMKIIEGILASGSGAELEEARRMLENIRKLTPDGGYVYPVSFSPTNWFELLDTSFTAVDLLKTPDVLAMSLKMLSTERIELSNKIKQISSMVADDKEVADAALKVKESLNIVNNFKDGLIKTYGNGITAALNTALDVATLFPNGTIPNDIAKKLTSESSLESEEGINGLFKALTGSLTEASQAQQKYVSASQDLADATLKATELKNLSELKNLLSPLRTKLETLDFEIEDIKTQIQLSTLVRGNVSHDTTSRKVIDQDTTTTSVAPALIPSGFTQIVIEAKGSSLDTQTSSSSSASTATSGSSFWFAGHHSQNSSASSHFSDFTKSSDTSIQIGMNVAKVEIEREWFNPGIFELTKDMYNVTTEKIAPNPATAYVNINEERLSEMTTGSYILPNYTVAMLIARDISVKLVSNSDISSEFADTMEQHASSGGGFLFFSGASSSSSNNSTSGMHATSTHNTVTLKFDTPQIIGYYLEAIAADKSSYLDDTISDAQAGYVTIANFVENYKKMLESMKSTERKS